MIFVAIPLIILAFMSLHVRTKICAYVDLLENKGFFAIRLMFLPVYSGLILIEGNNVVLKRKKREQIIRLSADAGDKNSVASYIQKPIVKVIVTKELSMYVEAGSGSDAFMSAMMAGVAGIAFKAVSAVSKAKNPRMKIACDFKPVYNKDELEVTFKGVFSLSAADALYGLSLELFKRKSKKQMYKQRAKLARRNALIKFKEKLAK